MTERRSFFQMLRLVKEHELKVLIDKRKQQEFRKRSEFKRQNLERERQSVVAEERIHRAKANIRATEGLFDIENKLRELSKAMNGLRLDRDEKENRGFIRAYHMVFTKDDSGKTVGAFPRIDSPGSVESGTDYIPYSYRETVWWGVELEVVITSPDRINISFVEWRCRDISYGKGEETRTPLHLLKYEPSDAYSMNYVEGESEAGKLTEQFDSSLIELYRCYLRSLPS